MTSEECFISDPRYTKKSYIYNTKLLSWEDARIACQKIDADLVSIHSQDEQDEINSSKQVKRKKKKQWWIGLRKDGEWKWTDNTEV